MKVSVILNLASIALMGASQAAIYTTNFNGFTAAGTDIAGQDGWSSSNTADQYSQVLISNVDYLSPSSTSKTLNLGDASAVVTVPSGANVRLSHGYGEIISSAKFAFVIADSYDAAFIARDSFGFSYTSAGANMLSFVFRPTAQSADPANPPDGTWDLFYNVGTGPAIDLNIRVSELGQYRFDMTYQPNADPLLSDFKLNISNALGDLKRDVFGIALDPNALATDFGFDWAKQTANYGSNSIIIDNLAVVPEPSSMLLLGVAGLGLVSRRKRA